MQLVKQDLALAIDVVAPDLISHTGIPGGLDLIPVKVGKGEEIFGQFQVGGPNVFIDAGAGDRDEGKPSLGKHSHGCNQSQQTCQPHCIADSGKHANLLWWVNSFFIHHQ